MTGQLFRHYKGGHYEVVTVAPLEATHALMVVYRNRDTGAPTRRPLAEFEERVRVNGVGMRRFERETLEETNA